MKSTLTPAAIDAHVGARLRLLRRAAGLSQEALAEPLGLTFQQVQKYERGANRVSASKLWEIAAILGVEVSAFFDGLRDDGAVNARAGQAAGALHTSPADQSLARFAIAVGATEVMRVWPALPRAHRTPLLNLMRSMADGPDGEPAPIDPAEPARGRALHS